MHLRERNDSNYVCYKRIHENKNVYDINENKITHSLTTWLHGSFRTPAPFTVGTTSALLFAFCRHPFTFSARKSFSTSFNYLSLELSIVLMK
jgi:hypothetical protein